jgi:catechol 2,3-dioxygenase-like lactoylglutathione lyase family enzyme
MRLVEGVHHVTFLTEDIDRLAAFYERVFDARKTLDIAEEGIRHIFLEVGATSVLHPFEILGQPLPAAPGRCSSVAVSTISPSGPLRRTPFANSVVDLSRKAGPTETSAI